MQSSSLLLVIDVADLLQPADVSSRVLLVARVLAAYVKATGGLVWRYKLVNLSAAPTIFQAALQDACKASLTGAQLIMSLTRLLCKLLLCGSLMWFMHSAGRAHLPFSSEEHVRCNCTMFEGLRRWLHHTASSQFQGSLKLHSQKKGTRLAVDTSPAIQHLLLCKR